MDTPATPDFIALAHESLYRVATWEMAYQVLGPKAAWPMLLELVAKCGWHPVSAARALTAAVVVP